MRFEDVLHEAGDFGKFQFWILGLLFVPKVIIPLHFMLHNFVGLVPSHHCALSAQDGLGNLTEAEKLIVSITKEPDGTFSSCKMYSEPQHHLLYNSSQENVNISSISQCTEGWQYDQSQVKSSIVSEWDLVCEKKGLNQAAVTFFFVGLTVGAVIFGSLSDRFGRRTILLSTFIITTVFGVAAAFSNSYAMFASMRAISGMSLAGTSNLGVTLGLEWIALQKRTFTGTIIGLSWCVGNMLLPLIAYCISEWRWLLFAVTVPNAVAILICWWVPESARWLLINGNIEMAEKVLKKCADLNGRADFSSKISKETLTNIVTVQESNKGLSYLHLVKTPKMRKLTFFSGIMWFGIVFTYYGISLKITGFGLNIYLTQFIYGAIEVPAKVITYFLLDRIGRRKGQAWSLIAAGAMIAVCTALPQEYGLARSLVAITGKGFSEAAFTVAILYTAELYPTIIRQTGIGYTGFVGRIGGSLAPLVMLLEDMWLYLPYMIFSFGAVLCGSAAFFLPETTNANLPETVEDIEQGSHMDKTANHPTQDEHEIFKITIIQKEELKTWM